MTGFNISLPSSSCTLLVVCVCLARAFGCKCGMVGLVAWLVGAGRIWRRSHSIAWSCWGTRKNRFVTHAQVQWNSFATCFPFGNVMEKNCGGIENERVIMCDWPGSVQVDLQIRDLRGGILRITYRKRIRSLPPSRQMCELINYLTSFIRAPKFFGTHSFDRWWWSFRLHRNERSFISAHYS